MAESFDSLVSALAKLPGFGKKSAERIAFHLAVSRREDALALVSAINLALGKITKCPKCGGVSENGSVCGICADPSRSRSVCLVETPADMAAIEKTGVWRGSYHVLGGKLSPIKNITEADLNFAGLEKRVKAGEVSEIVLALSNDIEGEA
ncbi:MAG: recombination protein RecR, partial [Opitutales bacterium]|nr:recombination protein RecR [Opitutales bacterium]